MNNLIRVRCLPDESIVFSSFEISLPTTADDMPEHMTLFTLHPSRRPIVSRFIPRNVESSFTGDFSMFYEFSPDFKYVVFPDSNDGLAILNPSTGELRNPPLTELSHLPSWRSANELCYGHLPKDKKIPEVVLFKLDKENVDPRAISTRWPTALLKSLTDGAAKEDS